MSLLSQLGERRVKGASREKRANFSRKRQQKGRRHLFPCPVFPSSGDVVRTSFPPLLPSPASLPFLTPGQVFEQQSFFLPPLPLPPSTPLFLSFSFVLRTPMIAKQSFSSFSPIASPPKKPRKQVRWIERKGKRRGVGFADRPPQ